MLQVAQTEAVLNSTSTQVLVQAFSDRVLVLVTQVGKVGTLTQATMPATVPIEPAPPADPSDPDNRPLPPPHPSIELTPLLGQAPSSHTQALHSLYASQIATLVWTAEAEGLLTSSRPGVIVGLALKRPLDGQSDGTAVDAETFHGVMKMVRGLLEQR
ncbi:hypothetical protein FA95DRAFT_1579190 [Auriscalpium vulgare]|uniref:Uncharacterized protein n=1 Tax=Auriscalpium vulgare TaxID=40419 RepID=A0ACB8SD53_9AGAM|nr:hypothetical protein FA95DRAFT_1579190 [Auriscalpium vulgare]